MVRVLGSNTLLSPFFILFLLGMRLHFLVFSSSFNFITCYIETSSET